MNATKFLKSSYVGAMRGARGLARATGLLAALELRPDRRAHWLRSLFAIHDIDAMVALDVPWWSYDAIDAVEAFLAVREQAQIFEYGSGASTVWAARRAASVVSVEHDAIWHSIVARKLDGFGNATLELVPPDSETHADFLSRKQGSAGRSFRAYVTAIERHDGPFDLIVIDGRSRVACLRQSLTHLAPGGMIVFDNSGRAEYRAALAALEGESQTLRGRVPSLPYRDQTTLIRPGVTVT